MGPSSPWKRFLLRAAGVGLSLVALGWAVQAHREHERGEALIAAAWRAEAVRPRPVHRLPSRPGTFEACVAPLLDRVPPSKTLRATSPEAAAVGRVVRGEEPRATLPATVEAELAALLPVLDEVLACTRAEAIGPEGGLGPFGEWGTPRDTALRTVSMVAGRALSLRARAATTPEESERSLQACADGLALARDLALDHGLVGAMQGASLARMMALACGAALGGAPASARRQLRLELATVKSGLPSLADILRVERAQMDVALHASLLSRDQAARLPPDTASFLQGHVTEASPGFLAGAAAHLYWPRYVHRMEVLIAAAEAPRRDTALASAEAIGWWEQALAQAVSDQPGSPPQWAAYSRRYEELGNLMDLLSAAAGDAHDSPGASPIQRSPADGGIVFLLHLADDAGVSIYVPTASPETSVPQASP